MSFWGKYLRYWCEARDFIHLRDGTRWNFIKTESFRQRKTLWILLKSFGILQNLMRNYEILWKFMKVDESWWKLTYSTIFFQSNHFRSVLLNCDVLLAFRNFVPWPTKFFCLLSYRFTSRQHRQIFRHRQTKGHISNIADTYFGAG